MTGAVARTGRFARLARSRVVLAIAAFASGALLAPLALAALADDEPVIERGATFEAEVTSYFDASGPEPNVICFASRDGDCGLPVFATEVPPDLRRGDRVRATEVTMSDGGNVRLVFFVEPLD